MRAIRSVSRGAVAYLSAGHARDICWSEPCSRSFIQDTYKTPVGASLARDLLSRTRSRRLLERALLAIFYPAEFSLRYRK